LIEKQVYEIFYENFVSASFNFSDIANSVNLNKFATSQFNLIHDLNVNKLCRFSNHINLRSPIRNSIVTYNAIQKVFRARFDEGRSNARLLDYSNSYVRQPYITSSRLKYEKILSKNKENFFNVNLYKNQIFSSFNEFYDLFTSLNFYTYDFPFLLALKSDASRYL
jgi:hypothetical protein